MVGAGEHQLCDAGPGLEFDGVVHLEQPLAAPLVAGVPDGGVEHTGVAQQRRAGVDEADVVFGDPDAVTVPEDVAAGVEAVDRRVVFDRLALPPVTDCFALAADPAGFDLLEDGPEREVDAVGLDLLLADAPELVGDELAAPEHILPCRSREKTLPVAPSSPRPSGLALQHT